MIIVNALQMDAQLDAQEGDARAFKLMRIFCSDQPPNVPTEEIAVFHDFWRGMAAGRPIGDGQLKAAQALALRYRARGGVLGTSGRVVWSQADAEFLLEWLAGCLLLLEVAGEAEG
jgi:hypothetical protein